MEQAARSHSYFSGLHALTERETFAALGEWDVRRHVAGAHAYFASRGFLHLQLWHAAARTSILTPSRLTNDRFEIAREGVRVALRTWDEVEALLSNLATPSRAEIAALCRWTVVRDEAEARNAVAMLAR